jgi:hypothetical protein
MFRSSSTANFLPLATLLILAASACGDGSGEASSSSAAPIIGGALDAGDPAVVALARVQGNQVTSLCSGTLVSPTVVLTAAHCVVPVSSGSPGPVSAGSLYAVFGETIGSPASTAAVYAVDWDPAFGGSAPDPHDLAVAILAAPVSVLPAPVSAAGVGLQPGQQVRIAGYGLTAAQGGQAGTKYSASTTIAALVPYPQSALMVETQGAKTACKGDSGGPMFASIDGADTVIAVTSGGDDGCTTALYAESGLVLPPYPNLSWLSAHLTSVVTSAGPYLAGGVVTVQYAGVPPSPTTQNWIGIAPQGAPANTYVAWTYLPAGLSGTTSLQLPATATPGAYVVRVFADDDFAILAESSPFAVRYPAATTADATSYAYRAPITVTSSPPQHQFEDWVAIAPYGSLATTYTAWAYTNGSDVVVIDSEAIVPGKYVARFLPANGFTIAGESAPFVVQPVPVSTNAEAYFRGDTITVSFSTRGAAAKDWVEIVTPQAPTSAYLVWQFTGGSGAGTVSLSSAALPPGSYVARFLPDDEMTSVGESAPFVVDP